MAVGAGAYEVNFPFEIRNGILLYQREGHGKKLNFWALSEKGGRLLPEFVGTLTSTAFLVNKKSLFLQNARS